MDIELTDKANRAITLTPDGEAHQVNVPLLKEVLLDIIERLGRIEEKLDES